MTYLEGKKVYWIELKKQYFFTFQKSIIWRFLFIFQNKEHIGQERFW